MGVFSKRQLLYNTEASFCENIASPTSSTFSANLPVYDLDVTLPQERIPDKSIQSRLAVKSIGHIGIRGPWTATFKMYMSGHNTSTATGALTATPLFNLLANHFGGSDSNDQGTTISGVASTAVLIDTVSATNLAAHSIVRVGTKGDARGDGQAAVISSIATNQLTMLTATPAAPTTAGDTVFATMQAFHDESLVSTLTTCRFGYYHNDTGNQFVLFGGQLAGLEAVYPIGNGELPYFQFAFKGATYERATFTFPDSTALAAHDCAPIAGGSLFYNAVGTATRAVLAPAELALTVSLGLEPTHAPGAPSTAAGPNSINGWVRNAFDAQLRVRVPWVTTHETLWDTANSSYTNRHALFTGNTSAGRAVGFYAPAMHQVGKRPDQPVEVDGQTFVETSYRLTESTVTTNALTLAALRFWFA